MKPFFFMVGVCLLFSVGGASEEVSAWFAKTALSISDIIVLIVIFIGLWESVK